MGRGDHRFHPYRRKGKAHFRFVAEPSMSNVIMDGESDAKRAKTHEAQLIPGLIPGKVYGFPNTIITKLRYFDSFAQSATLGAAAKNLWRANSIYDPDASNSGHQPMYHDQWTALYDQYVVIGSKITVTFAPTSSTVPVIVGVFGDDDASNTTTVQTLVEMNNSHHSVLGTTGSAPHTVTMTYEPNMCFGVDAKSDGASSTTVGTNPTEEWYWVTFLFAGDGSSTGAAMMYVDIEYTVKFSELKTPTQS